MKPAGALVLLALLPASLASQAAPPDRAQSTERSTGHTVLSCKLAPHQKIDLQAVPAGPHTVSLATRSRGKTEPAFNSEGLRAHASGTLALRLCLDGVLVYALQNEDGVRGAVLRTHPETHKLQRLEFSQAALPYGLYLSRDEMRVVVPTRGAGSTSHYMIYSSRTGQGRPSNMLPSGSMFTFYALQ